MPGMAERLWVFIDEQGDVKFGPSNSKHFGLAAITTDDPTGLTSVVDEVRHRWWSKDRLRHGELHAKNNCWPVRRDVFDSFSKAPISRVDVVALAKANVYERLRSPEGMYRAALRILMRYLVPHLPDARSLQWSPPHGAPIRNSRLSSSRS